MAAIGRAGYNWAVRIFCGIEPALRRSHVPPHIIKNVPRGRREFDLSCNLKSVEISARQLRLIIKHFLEVWHVPVSIDGISMKSAADVVMDSTSRHLSQREQDHFQGVLPRISIRIVRIKTAEEIKDDRTRKFRAPAETTFVRIERPGELLVGRCKNAEIDFGGRRLFFRGLTQRIHNLRS